MITSDLLFAFLNKLEMHMAGEWQLAFLKMMMFSGAQLFWVLVCLHYSAEVTVLILITNVLCSQLTRAFTPWPLLFHKVAL